MVKEAQVGVMFADTDYRVCVKLRLFDIALNHRRVCIWCCSGMHFLFRNVAVYCLCHFFLVLNLKELNLNLIWLN